MAINSFRLVGSARPVARVLLVASLACVGLAGCATSPDEDEGTNVTRSIVTATYGLEAFLRDNTASARETTLAAAALTGQPIDQSALDGGFSSASVRARVGVLILINAYVTKLAAVADNDSALEDVETTKTLDARIADLPRQFSSLRDATAAQYTAPVTAVLGWVGQAYTHDQRSQATRDALNTAAPAAKQLLDLLKIDLANIRTDRLRTSMALLTEERDFYNAHVRRLSLSDRAALASAIQGADISNEEAQTTAADTLIDALEKMHAALVTYVGSARTRADSDTVSQAMDDFAETVEAVTPALQQH